MLREGYKPVLIQAIDLVCAHAGSPFQTGEAVQRPVNTSIIGEVHHALAIRGAKRSLAGQVFLCASSTGTITEFPNREPYRQFAGPSPGWGREESWIGKHSG
jgi:hypothetical protein